MLKQLSLLLTLFACTAVKSQNPGLVISEVFANPAGTDSCKEYVELLAVQNINFSLTPFTVIVNNNGSANTSGWVAGGSLSYAFAINSGSVAAGNVVYVGGSCMTPTTGQLRVLNVKNVSGDWNIGSPNASGVFGNGGSNADGVAVFNLPVSSITSSTVPTDALFFGTGIGTSAVNSGADGYQLPVNDLYTGGKLNTGSFLAPDPGSDILLTASGVFDMASGSWTTGRSISSGTVPSAGASSVSLTTTGTVSPAAFSFVSNDTTSLESSNVASIFIRLSATSTASSSISVYATAFSNASATDYTIGASTFTFPANAPVNSTAAVTFSINSDVLSEGAEYVVLRFYNLQNATIGSIQQFAFYIADDDKPLPQATNALTLNLLSSFSNGVSGSNSAEIVAHDPGSQRLFIANSVGGKLDIVDFVNPSTPSLILSVPITTYGNINSVAVKNGIVACAIENSNPQDSGKVVFFNTSGTFLNQVKVGMMPDMVTFNNAGTRVITANEGEPNSTYTVDPDGSISIIDISNGIAALTQTNVSHVTFTVYNGQETALRNQGIRIYGPGATTSKDFEPEYIAVSRDDSRCWVTLQENNAVVEINLTTNTITAIRALGTKNHQLFDNGMDISNVTRGINIANFPVKGFYLPDAIASYSVGGVNYFITANEGDSRDYPAGGFSEEVRIGSANLDPTRFPFGAQMKNNSLMGRLNITNRSGDIDNDGDLDTLYSYGSRSFSIWNGNTGNLVYDSREDLERLTAASSFSALFNCSNTNNTRKDRSDDKGPEPEGVTTGIIGNSVYAFIALERIGGVMVYDVTAPASPSFVTYVNNRSLASVGGDRGAEGIIFIPQSQSPNGQHLVIAANEVSSSLSIWGIPGCASPLASSLSVSGATGTACSSNPPVLSVPSNSAASYQWLLNGSPIAGATSNTLAAGSSGSYSVSISSGSNCATSSIVRTVTVNPTPTLSITGGTSICTGNSSTLAVSGASAFAWSTGATSATLAASPSITTVYSVTGTGAGSCTGSAQYTLTVEALPQVTLSSTNASICAGQSLQIAASGAANYSWSTGSTNASVAVSPVTNTTYSVTGTGTNNCLSTATVVVTVNSTPTLSISGASQLCVGSTGTYSVSGANTYSWSGIGSTSVVAVSPSVTTVYTVTGLSLNSCTSSTTQTVVVNPVPQITITPANPTVCSGQSGTIVASGGSAYNWNTGSSSATLVVSPSSTTIYSVLVVNPFGCTKTQSVGVTVNPIPIVLISGTNAVCAGSQVTLTAAGANTYSWSSGNSGSPIVLSPATTTVYTVTGSSNGCSGTATHSIAIAPLPNLTINSTSTLLCAGESVTLSAGGAGTYTWSGGTTQPTLVLSLTSNTVVQVSGIGNNGCQSTAQFTQNVSACSALVEQNSISAFKLYPNPTSKEINVEFVNDLPSTITLIDPLGSLLLEQAPSQEMRIRLEQLPKGVYYLVAVFKTHTVSKKIILH